MDLGSFATGARLDNIVASLGGSARNLGESDAFYRARVTTELEQRVRQSYEAHAQAEAAIRAARGRSEGR